MNKPKHTILILLCALCLAFASSATAADEPWLNLPGAEHELVDEPVFGGQVWVYEAGQRGAPAVVLVHGLGDIAAGTWAGLIPELAKDYHVLTFDLPGFGRSSKASELYSPENYAALIKHLTRDRLDRPFKLVGHSLGGAVSLRYAADHPEDVEQLVLANVAGLLHRAVYTQFLSHAGVRLLPEVMPGQDDHLSSLAGRVLRRLEGLNIDADPLLHNRQLRAALLGGQPTQIAALALMQDDYTRRLRSVRAPTLIVWGERDPIAPVRTGKLLASNISGSRLHIMADLEHVPMAEDPRLFNRLVLEELARNQAELEKLAASRAYALKAKAPDASRVGHCENRRGVSFRGDYERIELHNCSDVRLTNVRTQSLVLRGARVQIENSHIMGASNGIDAQNSTIQMTGGSIRAERLGLKFLGSRADVAGVHIQGGEAAVEAVGGQSSEVTFSLSWVESNGREQPAHGVHVLRSGQTL